MRSYRFRLYPSTLQERQLAQHLLISKDIWNALLAKTKEKYQNEGKFYSRTELQAMTKSSGLYSQAAQAVSHRLHEAIMRKLAAKRQHRKWGFPRFKGIERMKSLHYPQFGFSLGAKLSVSPFGKISIVKHRQIVGKIRTLTLRRDPAGKWFAIFCAETEVAPARSNSGPAVGIDLGLEKFATLSDAAVIKNPRHLQKSQNKLAFLQKLLSRKQKRSRNRQKARLRLARAYGKVANCRHDFLYKAANSLLLQYSLIALEELQPQQMAAKGHGRGINDAAWKMFTNILAYKAESAGCKLVFVDPENTSKECSACGAVVEKNLWERRHNCPDCGLSIDRDLNASINILKRATAGIAGSNACGDEAEVSSLKQEACHFSGG